MPPVRLPGVNFLCDEKIYTGKYLYEDIKNMDKKTCAIIFSDFKLN